MEEAQQDFLSLTVESSQSVHSFLLHLLPKPLSHKHKQRKDEVTAETQHSREIKTSMKTSALIRREQAHSRAQLGPYEAGGQETHCICCSAQFGNERLGMMAVK